MVIRLEAGALAACTLEGNVSVEPFITEKFKNKMQRPSDGVWTGAAERTFLEKLTILNKESFRVIRI